MSRILFFKAIFLLGIIINSYGQADSIHLRKPSFEQKAHKGDLYDASHIVGWVDCGLIEYPGQTPPDIHPVDFWGNRKQAYDGETYLGIVTRDDDTREAVSQVMPSNMMAGDCYSFSLYLSRSEHYLSPTKRNNQLQNFVKPAVFKIYGGFSHCDEREKLGETVPIDHSEWKRYDFKFRPQTDIRNFKIAAACKSPNVIPYNGHILVDNLSPIVRVSCEEEQIIAVVEKKDKRPPHKIRRKKKKKPEPKKEEEVVETFVAAAVQTPKLLKKLDRSKIKKGQTIEIENLYFKADTTSINASSYDVLNEVYDFLAYHKDVSIEIGGHTNGTPSHSYCDRLSTERAKAVAEFLTKKGIPPSRLRFKGYGKRKPVANNFTAEGRKKNQRVEIKILSVG